MKKFFLVFLAVWRAKGRRHKGALERKNRRVASKVLCSFFHVVELSEWKEEKAAEVPNYIDYQSILQRGNTMASSAPFFFLWEIAGKSGNGGLGLLLTLFKMLQSSFVINCGSFVNFVVFSHKGKKVNILRSITIKYQEGCSLYYAVIL